MKQYTGREMLAMLTFGALAVALVWMLKKLGWVK